MLSVEIVPMELSFLELSSVCRSKQKGTLQQERVKVVLVDAGVWYSNKMGLVYYWRSKHKH